MSRLTLKQMIRKISRRKSAMSKAPAVNKSRFRIQISAVSFVRAVCAATVCCATSVLADPTGTVPDLYVNRDTGWLPVGDDLLPPPSGPGPVTFDKRYPYVDNATARRTRTQPTYRIADLSNPILQPWAIEQMRKANEDVLAGKVPFRPRESCHPAGVPGFLVYNLIHPNRFLQTAKQVTIINPGGPEFRLVYLNVPHSPQVTPSWYGESVGHYEGGDTLVVDTIGITTKAFVDNYRTPHTDRLHVVERFKLTGGGKALEVLVTVDDPGTFTTQWSAVQRFRSVERGIMDEAVCAENNINPFSFETAPIPQADRPDF
jgi:hypothetical protein